MTLISAVALALPRHEVHEAPFRLALVIPGLALGVLCLSLGPFRDASPSVDGEFVYRTGRAVGERSAGPRPVLADGALVRARSAGIGDPFVSGHPLPGLDPRRTYWSLAERFSGISPYFLVGKAEPALLLLGVLWAGVFALPRGSFLFGLLLFGSGFSFLLALVPAIRSWQFRIWAYLSESTDLADLLTEPETALLLLLAIALVTSRGRAPAVLSGIAMLVCEPAMALPLSLALLLFSWRSGVKPAAKISLLALVLIGFAVSRPAPFLPLLRALEYGRLDYLGESISHPLSGAGNALRTATATVAFLALALGLRTFALPRVFRDVTRSDAGPDRGLPCLVLALLLCGFMGLGPGTGWSLGLLLLWAPLAAVIDEWSRALPRGRRLAVLASSALLVYPVSIDYVLHYRDSEVERLSASEVELALTLRERSLAADPVLHRPNRSAVSLASHVAFRPAVLCYFGRRGTYDAGELAERSDEVRRFYETDDEAAARETVRRYGARFVLVEKGRPLRFSAPRWLRKVAESDNSILYEVN
jgi:hypothetical protein